MKTRNLRLARTIRIAALAALGVPLLAATRAGAQTYTLGTLYNFGGIDGVAHPTSGVTLDSSGQLYGTTTAGAEGNIGEVFVIPAGGNAPEIINDFNQDGSQGTVPGPLTVQDNGGTYGGNIYGIMSTGGGSANGGTVFAIQSSVGPVTTLATFTGANGLNPVGSLVVLQNNDYFGATSNGGASNDGTIFGYNSNPLNLLTTAPTGDIPPANAGVTTLASFDGDNGASPTGIIRNATGQLFGTTLFGGANGEGTVFEITGLNTITTLASFSSLTGGFASQLTLDSNGNLFGTTATGGTSGMGTVFEVAAGSNTITTIASFTGSNGADPGSAALAIDSHGNLYGTTQSGGSNNDGTVFKIADGTSTIQTVASFDGANGSNPLDSSISVGKNGSLYGTTYAGGTNNDGTVFKVSFAAPTTLTWKGSGGDNNWNTGGNWIGGAAPGPGAGQSVTFDGNARLSPNIEQPYSVYSLNFASTAGAFTLASGAVTIGDGGITQSSASNLQTIATSGIVVASGQQWNVNSGGLTVNAPISGIGMLTLQSAGTTTLTGNNTYTGGTDITGGGTVKVGDGAGQSSSLGTGNVTVAGATVLDFTSSSSAGAATVTVTGRSLLDFEQSSSAGSATINVVTNGPGILVDSRLLFQGNSTAANATINSDSGGLVELDGSATAGNATIKSAGRLEVGDEASLGNSHIDLEGPDATLVFQTSTAAAGGATVVNNAKPNQSGGVDISQAKAGVSIGSLSGAGTVALGGNNLTLGALGLDDTISGVITGNNILQNTIGSLTKVGSGQLTLTGANSISGLTTVNGGDLVIKGAGNYAVALSNAVGATLIVDSGDFLGVQALNGGRTIIYGGTIGAVDASTNSHLTIYGGAFDTITVGDPSIIDIYGGTFSDGITNDDPSDSLINLFGSDFSLSGPTVSQTGGDVDWTLTGMLADGETLNTEYIEQGTDTSSARGITFNAASAPEPSALALILAGLGACCCAAGCFRRKTRRPVSAG